MFNRSYFAFRSHIHTYAIIVDRGFGCWWRTNRIEKDNTNGVTHGL